MKNSFNIWHEMKQMPFCFLIFFLSHKHVTSILIKFLYVWLFCIIFLYIGINIYADSVISDPFKISHSA